MANASNYLMDEVLDHTTDVGAWTAPTALYVALLKSAAAASDTPAANPTKEIINQATAPGTNGYDREVITLGASSGGVSASTNTITFGPSTTGWSEATHYWICDAVTGGNILFQGALTASKTVAAAGSLVFAIGEITVTVA